MYGHEKCEHQKYANRNNRQATLCDISSVKIVAVCCNNVPFITN